MRTSASQVQLMLDFMERYGDLSKPSEGPQGRASNIECWLQLTSLLNADATGDTKTSEKWRKVWSDLKNNTKKKAARIYQAASGPEGGPGTKLKLSHLEERILTVMGTQAATAIDIPEVGLDQEYILPTQGEANGIQDIRKRGYAMEEPGCSSQRPHLSMFPRIESRLSRSVGGTSDCERTPPRATVCSAPSPSSERCAADSCHVPRPRTAEPQAPTPTPRRHARRYIQSTASSIHRRTRAQTRSDLGRRVFVRSDSEWRHFYRETERERIRLRQTELQQQERWLDLFKEFILLGNRIVDVLEKK